MKALISIFVLTVAVSLPTMSLAAWRTCVPARCSQEQATFDTLEQCIRYQQYQGSTWAKCFKV